VSAAFIESSIVGQVEFLSRRAEPHVMTFEDGVVISR